MKRFIGNMDRKIFVVYIFCIGIILLGITYALVSSDIDANVSTATIGIDTSIYGNTSFSNSDLNLYPILDYKVDDLISGSSTEVEDNVIYITFNVRGVSGNPSGVIYDIVLNNLSIDSVLLSKYVKWKLVKNGVVLTEGDFSGEVVSMEDSRMILTNIQQDLPSSTEGADSYVFVLWLSDSCQEEDITLCIDTENQDDMLDKSISGVIEVEVYTGNKRSNW